MKSKKNTALKNLTLSALFLSIAILLPMLTANIKELADSLLLMHLPVMLCGAIIGWKFGLVVGALAPIMRSLFFLMPPLYPNALYMAAELAAYGFVLGLLYKRLKLNIYISLIASQLAGRIVWGVFKALLLGISKDTFTFKAFIIGGFADAFFGIILQLIIIPLIIMTINKTTFITNNKKRK